MITHDLGVIAETADDVVVMYAGAIMESASRDTLFYENHHPYTEGLLRSLPAYGDERERLHPITGQPPSLINLPSGCKFHPRCPYAFDRCHREEAPLESVGGDPTHKSSCWLSHDPAERELVRERLLSGVAAS
jgi:oligopeptide/dipeptide ABC transporter ATP-binding protein